LDDGEHRQAVAAEGSNSRLTPPHPAARDAASGWGFEPKKTPINIGFDFDPKFSRQRPINQRAAEKYLAVKSTPLAEKPMEQGVTPATIPLNHYHRRRFYLID
jgi:hypothetical protein